MAQAVGVVPVLIGAGDLVDPLGDEILGAMGNIGRMAIIGQGPSHALGQTDLAVHTAQQQGAEVGRHGATVEVGPDSEAVDGLKSKLIFGRLGHGANLLAFFRSFLS